MLSPIRKLFSAALLASLFAPAIHAQGIVSGIGLTMSGAGAQFGSVCEPFACRPIPAGFPSGTPVSITAFGAPGTPYAIAVSLPVFGCQTFRGLSNALVLDPNTLGTIRIGRVGRQTSTRCQLGSDQFQVTLPRTMTGFQFGIQLVGVAPLGPFAPEITFSNALFVSVR